MMQKKLLPFIALLALAACDTTGEKVQAADNTILLQPQPDGSYVAVPPKCVPFDDATIDHYANDPTPQFGCTTAGNLARMIVNPADLAREETGNRQPKGGASGTVGAAAVQRYNEGKTYAPVLTPSSGN